MEFRYLGNSGLKVSEIIYGNWLTHASQVNDDQAAKTVHAALDAGITTYDTADAYANQAAEVVLGNALKGKGVRESGFSRRSTGLSPKRVQTMLGFHASTFLSPFTVL